MILGDAYEKYRAFHSGLDSRAYEYMGVHKEDSSYVFRVWAPNAEAVFLVGDFNGWDESEPMVKATDGGIYEARIDKKRILDGCKYKYKLLNRGREYYKSDPYCRRMEEPPNSASIICDDSAYEWRDSGWLCRRAEQRNGGFLELPMNVYELHTFSWKRRDDGELYSFSELADELLAYVKQMGYTHVELLPIMEHPYGGSWGYQVCGYFAPTSRGGQPRDLKCFVDKMHAAGIGVIFDFVPAHFPKDEFGLFEFDGEPLYEYSNELRRENRGWGTRYFNLGRPEVRSFLMSSAAFWIDEFHADGLRVDAVSSMIYLDYDRRDGAWSPNIYGDNRCLEGIDFLKLFNREIKSRFPDVLTVAEESSAWKRVTGSDGLGFDLKWNMGWMNDTLSYASTSCDERSQAHKKLTFPMMYAYDESFILPISHDEVVHGKGSFIEKMPGDYWQKFAGVRLFSAYQMTFPGKKLTFMGNEIAQFKEWNADGEIEWFLLDFEAHARYQYYVSELNGLYLANPELWQADHSPVGFSWLDADDTSRSIIAFVRRGFGGKELTVVLNFTPQAYENYTLKLDSKGSYEEIFNSDSQEFGGSGVTNKGVIFKSVTEKANGAEKNVLHMRLPPLGASILRRVENK